MIRSEAEYTHSVALVKEHRQHIDQERRKLQAEGLTPQEIKRALQPQRFLLAQIKDEVESYERLKRGEFDELLNLQGLGQLLIGLRIYRRMTQRELAERLECLESQVSRDEKNEYHNITVERARKILAVFGVCLRSIVDVFPGDDWHAAPTKNAAKETAPHA